MGKITKKLTATQKRTKKVTRAERRMKYHWIFIRGKQVRMKRPPMIDGIDVDEFISQNADPIWLHQNEMWEHSVEFVSGYSLRLSFSDGISAEVNFKDELSEGVFEALQDINYFRSFRLHPQFGTIELDNGADFAPEFLYELAQASGQHKAGFDAPNRSRESA